MGDREQALAAEQFANQERARAAEQRALFAQQYGVKPFKNCPKNLLAVLRSGGGDPGEARAVMEKMSRCCFSGPFDHGEIWGKDGRPAMLVGHPYQLNTFDIPLLYRLEKLGLWITISNPSHYGFGTVRVIAQTPDRKIA